MLTAPQLAWTAAGCPRPNEKYDLADWMTVRLPTIKSPFYY